MSENKLTGKESAKLNKRMRFYSKLERFVQNDKPDRNFIAFTLNKKMSFPEFEDISMLLMEESDEFAEEEVISDISDMESIDLPFLDDVRFFIKAQKQKFIDIIRRETDVNDNNVMRKGASGAGDNYNYQQAFVWGFTIKDKDKFLKLIEQEKEEPSDYVVKTEMKKIARQKYKKSYKQFRPRRKK